MKVAMYTWGSEGDIRPFFALALGLARAGHEVSIGYVAIDGRDYGPLARAYGLDARAVAVEAIARARETGDESDAALAGEGHPLRQIETVLTHFLDPAVESMWEDAAATLPGSDVAIVHLLHHPAASIALAHRIPIVALQPVPIWPTRALPPMGAPDLGRLNRLAWWMAEKVGGAWFLPRVNASRRRAGVPLETSMFPRRSPAALTLTCVSTVLVPRPSDWDESQRIPGFFELPAESLGWEMPNDLRAFLETGEPPLLMGFGSMLTKPTDDTKHCVRALVGAAELAGRRALVQAPWDLLPDVETPAHVYRLDRAPHALVLPHCSAFVHHGGSGTTHTACLAGKPSVVVPFLGDQFFWAERLRALGVAPAPVPRKRLRAPRLASAIRALAADPLAAPRAVALAEAMGREDGVAEAVRLIESIANASFAGDAVPSGGCPDLPEACTKR